ncbi:hypothetical protein DERF_007054 [Dermatophagoides farinae]|uniref:Uncharacterized protein n=1 Tax=Dermatophagoides farinae TaxID=6954 RepID=A0A922I0A1_DERFA|nr:hypothetical protein DERF_007054 [Dermatophagoides farinae]
MIYDTCFLNDSTGYSCRESINLDHHTYSLHRSAMDKLPIIRPELLHAIKYVMLFTIQQFALLYNEIFFHAPMTDFGGLLIFME